MLAQAFDRMKEYLLGTDDITFPVDEYRRELDWARLSSWVEYEYYDSENEVFRLGDSLGILIEIQPQIGADESTIETLSTILTGAADGTAMQIQTLADHNIDTDLDRYLAARVLRDGVAGTRKRIDWIRKAQIDNDGTDFKIMRKFRSFISVTVPGTSDASMRKLIAMRSQIEASLTSAMFGNRRFNATDLIKLAHRLMNPTHPEMSPYPYSATDLLKHQVVERDTKAQVRPNEILLDNSEGHQSVIRCYSVSKYPEKFSLWMMHNLLGNFYQPTIAINAPFLITLGIYVRDTESQRATAQLKSARATQNAESNMAKLLPDLADKKRDWDIVNRALLNGDELLSIIHQVVVFGQENSIAHIDQSIKQVFRASGFQLVTDRYMQSQAFISSLPMGMSKTMCKDILTAQRFKTVVTRNAINTAPLLSEWGGNGGDALLLFGRRGQLIMLDTFLNDAGNYNCAISGTSGSGKSVLMQEMALAYYNMGAQVWIMDVGRSYEKLCDTIGGTFLEFSDQNVICVNPFSWVSNIEQDMDMIKPLISMMASPKIELDTYSSGVIEIAIRQVWHDQGNDATITDVRNLLMTGQVEGLERDTRISDLGTMLTPYAEGGLYGRYFNGPATINFDSNFVVLELEELKGKKDLQSSILFIMLYYATNQMYLNRDKRTVFMIDEAWDMMDAGTESGKFIESGYRRARKYDGMFVTGTQGVADYYKNPASQAALDNSDWIFLLRQKTESIESLLNDKRLALDEGSKQQVISLRTEHGAYSEVWVKSPQGQGICRLYLDPYHQLLYSTKASDFNAIKAYKDQGMSTSDAINRLLKERGEITDE